MRRHAVLAVLLPPALLAGACGDPADPRDGPDGTQDTSSSAFDWQRVPQPPLSDRYAPLLAAVDGEVLVLGGHTADPCPPNAGCVDRQDGTRDGAALDLDTREWRPVAPAPVEVDRFTGHVVAGGLLVLGDGARWWTYDPTADAWADVPDPPGRIGPPETTRSNQVFTHVGGDVTSYDVSTQSWTSLPSDQQRPPLTDGTLVDTTAGLVLTGVNYDQAAPDEPTLTQVDILEGGGWRRLPSTGMIGPLTHWTGARLIGVGLGGADGGEVNRWDRWYPEGGAFDPTTGDWSPLRDPPGYEDVPDDVWRLDAAAGAQVAAGGFVYDDGTATWTAITRPDGSALVDNLTSVLVDGSLVVYGGSGADLTLVGEVWVGG